MRSYFRSSKMNELQRISNHDKYRQLENTPSKNKVRFANESKENTPRFSFRRDDSLEDIFTFVEDLLLIKESSEISVERDYCFKFYRDQFKSTRINKRSFKSIFNSGNEHSIDSDKVKPKRNIFGSINSKDKVFNKKQSVSFALETPSNDIIEDSFNFDRLSRMKTEEYPLKESFLDYSNRNPNPEIFESAYRSPLSKWNYPKSENPRSIMEKNRKYMNVYIPPKNVEPLRRPKNNIFNNSYDEKFSNRKSPNFRERNDNLSQYTPYNLQNPRGNYLNKNHNQSIIQKNNITNDYISEGIIYNTYDQNDYGENSYIFSEGESQIKKIDNFDIGEKKLISEINFDEVSETNPLFMPLRKIPNLKIENQVLNFHLQPVDPLDTPKIQKLEKLIDSKKDNNYVSPERTKKKPPIPHMKQDISDYSIDLDFKEEISISSKLNITKETKRDFSEENRKVKNEDFSKSLTKPRTTKAQELRMQKSRETITKLEKARNLKKQEDLNGNFIKKERIKSPKSNLSPIKEVPKREYQKPRIGSKDNPKQIPVNLIKDKKTKEQKGLTTRAQKIIPSVNSRDINDFSTARRKVQKKDELSIELDLEDLLRPSKTNLTERNERKFHFNSISPVKRPFQRDSLNFDKNAFK